MKSFFSSAFLVFAVAISVVFFSCVSPRVEEVPEPTEPLVPCSRALSAPGVKTAGELTAFFCAHNPDYPIARIASLAALYIEEAHAEHINSDAAFVQMCLETGFLRYGNLVTPDMNNFCGLGALDAAHPGERFETPQLGVRAHIQHLQAYATDESVSLTQELVDPRYSWVHKAKSASTIFELAGQWAADKQYGEKLERLLSELEATHAGSVTETPQVE